MQGTAMHQSVILFRSVLNRTIDGFAGSLIQEIHHMADDLDINKTLKTFPRLNQDYNTSVSILSNIASFDVPNILKYLSETCIYTFQNNRQRSLRTGLEFSPDFDPHQKQHMMLVRYFQLIFISDLILTIVSSYPDKVEPKVIINLSFYLCKESVGQTLMYDYVLPQYAVAISTISERNLKAIYDTFISNIYNKVEPFFVLFQFIRLDVDTELSENLLEVLLEYLDRNTKSKTVTNYMLKSVASAVLTYVGSDELVQRLQKQAEKFINDPKLKYGAIDLRCAILARNGTRAEKQKFAMEQVYPLLGERQGFTYAVDAFHKLVFGRGDTGQFFWVWSPKLQESNMYRGRSMYRLADIIDQPEEKRKPYKSASNEEMRWAHFYGYSNKVEYISQASPDSLTSIFMKFFFPSPFFGECSKRLRDILVYIAAADFEHFLTTVTPEFTKTDDDRFTTFLTCVPIFNSKSFQVDKKLLERFNKCMGEVTYEKLIGVSLEMQSYRYYSNKSRAVTQPVEVAAKSIESTTDKWGVNPGPSTTMTRSESAVLPKEAYIPSTHLVEIIPYILRTDTVNTQTWTTLLVKLAASNNSSVSEPARTILEQNIDDRRRRPEFTQNLTRMITLTQEPEITFVCLKLLIHATADQEPRPEDARSELFDHVEYVAFLCLASEQALIRISAYNLLKAVNKLQRGDGIYAHIEKHTAAIESNAKSNMLMQLISRRPDHAEYFGGEITLRDALCSPYLNVWLFFLAEFGRILSHLGYAPVISGLSKIARSIAQVKPNHLTVGIYTILFSTCSIEQNIDEDNFVYETKPMVQGLHLFEPNNVMLLITKITRGDLEIAVGALKHANYTLVPRIFSDFQRFAKPKALVRKMDTLHYLMKTVEGNERIKGAIFQSVHLILDVVEKTFMEVAAQRQLFVEQESLLHYLCCLKIWLETESKDPPTCSGFDITKRSNVFLILEILKARTTDIRLPAYASSTLYALLTTGKGLGAGSIMQAQATTLLDYFLWCEEHEFRILRPLLSNDFELFVDNFIEKCFNTDTQVSDYYFGALSEVAIMPSCQKIAFARVDLLLLVGFYKYRTGSSIAAGFIKEFAKIYADSKMSSTYDSLVSDLESMSLTECITKHFIRMSEAIVKKALTKLMASTFVGSFKVMVDIVTPFIKQFRLLPNQQTCLPSMNSLLVKMTPYSFMTLLLDVTEKASKQDFETVGSVWSVLLNVQDHVEIIPPFIFECGRPQLQKDLMMFLIEKHPKIMIRALASRFKFSFYAYCTYQEDGANFDQQMWMVPVMSKAIKNHSETAEFLPVVLQFALLFHSTHTQSLLKRLCKISSIRYSRRTLSNESLIFIVNSFQKIYGKNDEFIKQWAMEAMLWVVGCRSLKIATTSLVILNHIKFRLYEKVASELLDGIVNSVKYFLGSSVRQSPTLYEFINESFNVFNSLFEGNEMAAFNFLRAFFDFVIHVDAYFENMLPLYIKCKESPVTSELANPYMLNALRPIFNELESDGRALRSFQLFAKTEVLIDLDFVSVVLKPQIDHERVKKLVKEAQPVELNRALGHYSFMSLTASSDLKRRIFKVSSLILARFIAHRTSVQKALKTAKLETSLSSSSLNFQGDLENDPENEREEEENLFEYYANIKDDLNKHALSGIYKAALERVTACDEAVEFIMAVSHIDPLIASMGVADAIEWSKETAAVAELLDCVSDRDSEIVTLTKCDRISDASRLLNKESRPRIDPFASQRDIIGLIRPESVNATPARHFSKWVKNITDVSVQLKDSLMLRIAPAVPVIHGEFKVLEPPAELLDSDAIRGLPPRVDPVLSADAFLRLALPRPALSRQSSKKSDIGE